MTTTNTNKLDVGAVRESIVTLCLQSKCWRVRKIGARMAGCGQFQLPLFRRDAAEGDSGRPLVLGCRCRICPTCMAARRGRYDRRYRPQLQALQAAGYPILFITLTRQTQEWQPDRLRQELQEVRECWSSLRKGDQEHSWRRRWREWSALIAGGLYGLEATLYRRGPGGVIEPDADGVLPRRNHAHLHAVVVLHPHVDHHLAEGRLRDWWLDACRARGWEAAEDAQDVQLVDAERLENEQDPLSYVVKYIGKPDDLLSVQDAEEFLEGCRGLRQVQTFGVLHGAALRKVRALMHAPTEPARPEHLSLWQLAQEWELETSGAAESWEQAAETSDQWGEDAGQRHRRAARRDEHTAGMVDTQAGCEQAGRLPQLCALTDAQLMAQRLMRAAEVRAAAAAKRAAELEAARAHELKAERAELQQQEHEEREGQHAAAAAQAKTERAAELRERWAESRRRRAQRAAEHAARRQRWALQRRQRATEAGALAATYSDDLQRGLAAASSLHGRALVLHERAAYDHERSRWHVVRRDDLMPHLQRMAYAATDHSQVDAYSGAVYALRDRAERRQLAQVAYERAQGRLQRELRKLGELPPDTQWEELAELPAYAALVRLREDVTETAAWRDEAERGERELRQRLPVSVDLLRCAADFGDGAARRWAALLDEYEQERAKRAQGKDHDSQVRTVPKRVRHRAGAAGAQPALPGVGVSSTAAA